MLRVLSWIVFGCVGASACAATIGFEEFASPPYALGPESFYNGSDGAGGFTSGGAFFNNDYIDFGGGFYAWRGWSVSNVTDIVTPGYVNEYAAYNLPAGGGAGGSALYGVAFSNSPGDATINLPAGLVPQSVQLTNTTYAALSMRDGDAFAKKFGGLSGDDPDYFKLIITGLDMGGTPVGTVDFYLADYRFAQNELDYIVSQWTTVDLSSLAGASRLSFAFESSDVGPFGINTPTYVALDNLVLVPEPASVLLVGLAMLVRGARRCAAGDRS
ncbi:MAG: DUF4465 domain-containing protein [Phycisphaerales bacterium]|nr:DUF4465 domain-containing protein [Phycisphaerales bacterium]